MVICFWHRNGANLALTYEWLQSDLPIKMPAILVWPWHMNDDNLSKNGGNLTLTHEWRQYDLPKKWRQSGIYIWMAAILPWHMNGGNLALTYEWRQSHLDIWMVAILPCHMNGGNLTLTREWLQSDLDNWMPEIWPWHMNGGNMTLTWMVAILVCPRHMNSTNLTLTFNSGNMSLTSEWLQSDLGEVIFFRQQLCIILTFHQHKMLPLYINSMFHDNPWFVYHMYTKIYLIPFYQHELTMFHSIYIH